MKKLSQEEYINKCNEKHNFKYDYSKINYVNRRTKIEIGCKIHGYFWQEAGAHLYKNGCPKCNDNNIKYSFEDFVKKANKIHNFKFEYLINEEFNNINYINIKCNKHGIFRQKPCSHLTGRGCNKCAIEDRTLNNEKFINKANIVHNHKYDYSNIEYKHSLNKIEILCKYHGSFFQSPSGHLNGRGCSKCFKTSSRLEKEILNFVKSICKNVKNTDRDLLGKLELDIVIPDCKLAIEVNGTYWHYNRKDGRRNHVLKSKLCKEKGYTLLHLREDLWKKDKEKMKQVIKTLIYR